MYTQLVGCAAFGIVSMDIFSCCERPEYSSPT